VENRQLLAQDEVLGDQGRARKKDGVKKAENQPDHAHCSASIRVL
jgi:hypothetical protein